MIKNIKDILEKGASQFPQKIALQTADKSGRKYTYADLHSMAHRISASLIELGIEPGDHIAILSESRPEFGIAAMGIISAGAVITLIDVNFDDDKIILSDGSYLSNNDIENIIQQMNAYAQDNGIDMTNTEAVRNNENLMTIIQNSWKVA